MREEDTATSAAGPSAAYPAAPWLLRGWGVATLQPVDLAAAQRVAPPGAHVVPIWPGRTLGGFLFLSYGKGSTLQYNELNIVAGLVRFGGRLAFWLPRLFVDSVPSLVGGRAIWGAPKELADFTFRLEGATTTVEIVHDARLQCRLRFATPERGLRMSLPSPAVGLRDGVLVPFTGKMSACFTPVRVDATVPASAEHAGLCLDHPTFGFHCGALELRVPAPSAERASDRGSP